MKISIFAAALAFSALASSLVPAWSQRLHFDSQPGTRNADPRYERQPLSQEEIRTRTQKLIANQHSDDLALEQYERIERRVDRTGGANPRTLEDKTFRVVPNGAGATKLLLSDNGKPIDPLESRLQLQNLVQVLQMMLNPNDPRMKTASAKHQKRMRDSAELVDSVADAFILTWQGQESKNGRDCDVIQANPNPKFHPHSMFQDALVHVSAKAWVDHSSDQIVHIEAQILSDTGFGGGLFGKLYRGGTFTIDQAEIARGVWLPIRSQYDFSGRKFLFPFEVHQLIEARHYRMVGSPEEVLALIQNELAGGKPTSGDP